MFDLIMLCCISILFLVIGTSMVRGNIKWLHSYHRKRIQQKDEPIVGKWCGIGLYIIGIGILLTGILQYLGMDESINYVIIPTLVIGIGMNTFVIFKYNKGLF